MIKFDSLLEQFLRTNCIPEPMYYYIANILIRIQFISFVKCVFHINILINNPEFSFNLKGNFDYSCII